MYRSARHHARWFAVSIGFSVAILACDDRNAPIPCSTPPQTVQWDGTASFVPCFTDPDGDPVAYAAEASDLRLATVSVAGETVTIMGRRAGELSVFVTASDPDGLSAVQEVAVTVQGPRPDVAITEASPLSQTVPQGGRARFTFRVTNDSDVGAGPTHFDLRVSRDSIINLQDDVFFSLPYDPKTTIDVSAHMTLAMAFSLAWQETPGTRYYGVCAHPTFPESNKANNCSVGLRVVTTAPVGQTSNED